LRIELRICSSRLGSIVLIASSSVLLRGGLPHAQEKYAKPVPEKYIQYYQLFKLFPPTPWTTFGIFLTRRP
jgi:hypothetical protein